MTTLFSQVERSVLLRSDLDLQSLVATVAGFVLQAPKGSTRCINTFAFINTSRVQYAYRGADKSLALPSLESAILITF